MPLSRVVVYLLSLFVCPISIVDVIITSATSLLVIMFYKLLFTLLLVQHGLRSTFIVCLGFLCCVPGLYSRTKAWLFPLHNLQP